MDNNTMTSKATKRISLVDGLNREVQEPSMEAMQQFVKTGNAVAKTEAVPALLAAEPPVEATRETAAISPAERSRPPTGHTVIKPRPSRVQPVALVPVTIRLRPELAGALKRASLERQLTGDPVFTQQDMVEEALTPWLKKSRVLVNPNSP